MTKARKETTSRKVSYRKQIARQHSWSTA